MTRRIVGIGRSGLPSDRGEKGVGVGCPPTALLSRKQSQAKTERTNRQNTERAKLTTMRTDGAIFMYPWNASSIYFRPEPPEEWWTSSFFDDAALVMTNSKLYWLVAWSNGQGGDKGRGSLVAAAVQLMCLGIKGSTRPPDRRTGP